MPGKQFLLITLLAAILLTPHFCKGQQAGEPAVAQQTKSPKKLNLGFTEVEIDRIDSKGLEYGLLDQRVDYRGLKGRVYITPDGPSMFGAVYLTGRIIYQGDITLEPQGFRIPWQGDTGNVGCEMDIIFTAITSGGKILEWQQRGEGQAWIEPKEPYDKQSTRFVKEINRYGIFQIDFWKLTLKIDVVNHGITWWWSNKS